MPEIRSHNKLFFILSILAYITALLLYGFWNNYYQKKEILAHVDIKLYNHAISLKYILPDDYHDRAIDAQSISIDEDKYVADKLTRIAKETDFKYNYMVIKKDDKLFFTASDLIVDPENERGTFYYYEYEGADDSFLDAFEKETPTYKTVSDQWGPVRTVMVPEKSPGGIKYLACVDYDISYVAGLLRKNLTKSIATVIFFLLLAIPIIKVYTSSYKDFLKNLKESEGKYRRLAENAKDMIYRMSVPDGKYEYVSPAAESIFGYPAEAWYDNPALFKNIIHPDYSGYFKEKWDQLLNGELDPTYAYKILYGGSETRWIHQRNVDIRDENGKLIAIEGIATDITDLKLSEKALQESHKRFRTVLDSIDATVFVVDLQTHEILFMNQYMVESFGRDMTGEIFRDVHGEGSSQYAHCPIDKLVDKDGNPQDVYIWQTQDSITQKWYMNYDRAIEWTDGRIVKLQIASDITKLKRMEEELRQVQKMESIGTISGGIAHDFNNILSIIIGNAEMSIEDVPESSPAHDNLKAIKAASLRAKEIVKQLLSFTRKTEQTKKNIQLLPIIEESIKLVRSSIPTTIDIQLNAAEIEGVINADSTQIHQILINMCTNAAHAMDENGGTLTISLSEIELDKLSQHQFQDVEPGKFIQLSIADTGSGVESSIVDKIFDPYFTTKDVGKGSGLGLAVVHGIVKSYNGAISVDSKPLQGTTFTIVFPSATERSTEEEKSTEIIPTGSGKILIVDDEEALAKMGAAMLEQLGYDVVYQTDSIQALALIKAKPSRFELIITDMAMPSLSGDQLAQQVLEINPDMPIILSTGFSHKIDRKTALELGIREYIDKPFSRAQLAAVVRSALADKK